MYRIASKSFIYLFFLMLKKFADFAPNKKVLLWISFWGLLQILPQVCSHLLCVIYNNSYTCTEQTNRISSPALTVTSHLPLLKQTP